MSTVTAPPPAVGRKRRLGGHLRSVLAALCVVALVSAGLIASVVQQTLEQQSVNEFIRAEIVRLETQIKDIAAIRAEIATAVAERQIHPEWLAQRQWPARVLWLLAQSRPPACSSNRRKTCRAVSSWQVVHGRMTMWPNSRPRWAARRWCSASTWRDRP